MNAASSLRVLHVIPSLSPRDGGPSVALPLMARALETTGVRVTVATTDADGPGTRLAVPLGESVPDVNGGGTRIYFRRQTNFYKCSLPLARWLWDNVENFDVVHIHALFTFSSVVAALAAVRRGVPYLVRPLGVLNGWGLQNRRPVLKRLSLRWCELPILRGAAMVHYTSEGERREASLAHPEIGKLPSAVIPLGIDTDLFGISQGPGRFLARFPQAAGRRLVLFLSRLDAKKGLDLLLPAFAEVFRSAADTMLVLAGAGDERFTAALHELTVKLGISDQVLWTGFLDGEDKLSAFAAAEVFVLPSYSENFGIAAAEALAAGRPTILCEGVALAGEAAAAGAAMMVPPTPAALEQALLEILGDATLRERLSVNARQYAMQRFSLSAVGHQLREVYLSIATMSIRMAI